MSYKARDATKEQRRAMRRCRHSSIEMGEGVTPVYVCEKDVSGLIVKLPVCIFYNASYCKDCSLFPERFGA